MSWDLIAAPIPTPEPVTDLWGIPEHLYRPGPGRPLNMRRREALLNELAWIRDCTCPCHPGPNPHMGEGCECGPTSKWAARLGVSAAALLKAEQRGRAA